MSATIDRREFLARSALGVAALALPAMWPLPVRASVLTGMFLSLPPWALARNVGWPEQARIAARAGYKGIDWPFGPARTAGVEATKALFDELAIAPNATNLPMREPLGADDAAFHAQLPKLAEDAAFCRAIGCSRFQIVLGPTTLNGESKAARWAVVQRRLSALSAVLAPHEMRLGVEFLGPLLFRRRRNRPGAAPADSATPVPQPVPFVWTLNETLPLCEAAGPNIGVTLDAWHWFHSGGTVADIRAMSASRVVHVHISDAAPMPPEEVRDDVRLMPGEGVIDLIGFLQALKAIGYHGGVAPEILGPRIPEGMSPDESARLGLEATLAVMRKAGVA